MITITKTIFRMFEPITFPTTRSVFFLTIAAIVAASSGRLVPIAIRTRPTIMLRNSKLTQYQGQ